MEAVSFVSELTGVSEKDILSRKRHRDAVVSRHFFRYYLRKNFKMTLQSIGDLTNNHHASILHSINYVKDYSLFDKTYKLYKESIDERFLLRKITEREKIYNILSKDRSNEFKCNAILTLIRERDESSESN